MKKDYELIQNDNQNVDVGHLPQTLQKQSC